MDFKELLLTVLQSEVFWTLVVAPLLGIGLGWLVSKNKFMREVVTKACIYIEKLHPNMDNDQKRVAAVKWIRKNFPLLKVMPDAGLESLIDVVIREIKEARDLEDHELD